MQRLEGEGQQKIKMEKQDPDEPKRENSFNKTGGRNIQALQTGNSGEVLSGMVPKQIKQESEEEVQQHWEAQWQEFLREMQTPCMGQQDIQLPPRPECGESPVAFQDSSERAVDSSRWPQKHGAQTLPHLTREVTQISRNSLNMSVKVKEEAPYKEPISSEVRRQHFRQFCYGEAKHPREVCKQLQELCHQWLKPEEHTKEQILELVTLEQFLKVLPSEMQSWVMAGSPQICAHAVSLAEDFLLRLEETEKRERQVLQSFEEVIVNSPKSERESSDTEEMQLCLGIEEDGKTQEFGEDGRTSRNEDEYHQSEKHEQPEAGRVALNRARRKCPQDPLGVVNETQNLQSDRTNVAGGGNISVGRVKDLFFSLPEEGEVHGSHPGHKQHHKSTWKMIPEKDIDYGEEGVRSPYRAQSPEQLPTNPTTEYMTSFGQSIETAKTPSYECSYCGKQWPCQSQLRRHVKIHTGERPHKCAECGKSFSTSSNLSQHKRVHTGERPYSCKDCGKSYRRRASLVQHERETCRKGNHLNASAVGYVVLGNCTLLCMKKAAQDGKNRVIAPKGGEVPLAAQP